MQLSKRLEMILKLIPESRVVADVGTDHGFLGIRIIEEKKALKVIASDVAEGPLSRAKEHIAEAKMENQIETRLGSGLSVLRKNEADTIVMAGMGGLLIRELLKNDREISENVSCLVLSPHKDAGAVRRYLSENRFRITDEEIVPEDGKFYPVLQAVPHAGNGYTEQEIRFGPVLLKKKTEFFKSYLLHEKERVEKIMKNREKSRRTSEDGLPDYLREVTDLLNRF